MQPVKFQESRVGRVGRVGRVRLVTCLVALHRICFDETHFGGKWWLLSVSPSVPNSSTLFHVVPFVLCHSVYFAESFLMKPEVLSIKGLMLEELGPENIRELLGLGCFSPFSCPGAWCFSGCFRGISMPAFPWDVVACAQRSSLKLRTVLTIMDSNDNTTFEPQDSPERVPGWDLEVPHQQTSKKGFTSRQCWSRV
jgi:hypothetical protein